MNDPAAKLGSLRTSLRDLGAALGAPGAGTPRAVMNLTNDGLRAG